MAVYSKRLQDIFGRSEAAVRASLVPVKLDFPRENGQPNDVIVWANRHVMAARLRAVNAHLKTYCKQHNVGYTIHPPVGCFNWRYIRGIVGLLSMHSGAIAVDVNPAANPMTYGKVKTDMPKWFVAIWKAHGFEWGGGWISRKDAMHYELCVFTEPGATRRRFPLRAGHVFGNKRAGNPKRHDGSASAADARNVMKIQRKVGVADDGHYGPRTAAAVKAWKQRKFGSKVNALVGPITWKAMGL